MAKDEIQYIQEDMRFEDLKDIQQRERVLKLLGLPIDELLKRYVKSQTYEEEGKVLNDDYYDVPEALREILNLASVSQINESIKSIKDAVENLDAKLRNHRHDTTKQFSAKPEF